jgi:hypothetical protein
MARDPGIVKREAGRYPLDRHSRHRQRHSIPIHVAVAVAHLERCRDELPRLRAAVAAIRANFEA